MTTTTSNGTNTETRTKPTATIDAAAQASIGAAARELHLPTVRAEATRLADIALRERQTHLRYLSEVLAAEVDDRTERRRAWCPFPVIMRSGVGRDLGLLRCDGTGPGQSSRSR
jgi:hypothetical protein